MSKWLKEALWLFGFLVLPAWYVLGGGISQTFDINVHDTYFVIEAPVLAVIFILPLLVIVYFIRVIVGRFNNAIATSIFMIATIFLVVYFSYIIEYIGIFNSQAGWNINPSTGTLSDETRPMKENSGNTSFYLIITQFILMLLLAFTAFKTGQKFRKVI
ncbi:hypothetical protein [Flavobacterium sp.]|uniref:hypothetical protein n=1 Tax=Flavobacterium sp. TaxID=239 RepID=UPI004033CA1B